MMVNDYSSHQFSGDCTSRVKHGRGGSPSIAEFAVALSSWHLDASCAGDSDPPSGAVDVHASGDAWWTAYQRAFLRRLHRPLIAG